MGWDVEQGYRMGTQTPVLLLCMAKLRCKSKKGPVQARVLAWHENREAQLAAPPLPLLSIPGCIFCWPGQIRWILDPSPAPGLKPSLLGQALGLAALLGLFVPHSTGTAIWHLGLCCQWWGWLSLGHLRARSQSGCGHFVGTQLVYGIGTGPFSTGEIGEKLKQKGDFEMAHSLLKVLSDKILIWGVKDVLLL